MTDTVAEPPPGGPADAPTPRLPRLWPWITLVALGVVAVVVGVVLVVASWTNGLVSALPQDLAQLQASPLVTLTAPGTVSVPCVAGQYGVFQAATASTPTTSSAGPSGFSGSVGVGAGNPTTLRPDQVVVTGPSGARLRTFSLAGDGTFEEFGTVYSSAVGFDVPAAGTYTVRVAAVEPPTVAVGPFFQLPTGWRLTAVVPVSGAVAFVAGVVMVVVTVVRRRRVRRLSAEGGPAPGPIPVTPGDDPGPPAEA